MADRRLYRLTKRSQGIWVMRNRFGSSYFDFYCSRASQASRNKKYGLALMLAFRGYLVATELNDPIPANMLLELIRKILLHLENHASEGTRSKVLQGRACSFCLKTKATSDLTIGTYGTICMECIADCYERSFGGRPRKKSRSGAPKQRKRKSETGAISRQSRKGK